MSSVLMTTTSEPTGVPAIAARPPIDLGVADQKIADWKGMYLPLTISSIDDKEGFEAVSNALSTVREHRISVEKKRVELKAGPLELCRAIDGEAKRVTALLEPIETHLDKEKSRIVAEKEKIKQAKKEAEAAEVRRRCDTLAACGASFNPLDVAGMSPEFFASYLAGAEQAKAERERAAAEEAKRQADEIAERARIQAEEDAKRAEEAKRLAAERAELDRMKAEHQAEANRLATERQRLADEQASRDRADRERVQAELQAQRDQAEAQQRAERERIEANRLAEQQRIEAQQLAEHEAAEAQRKAETEEAARLRAEALKPIRQRIVHFVNSMPPDIKLPESDRDIEIKINGILRNACHEMIVVANSL